MKTAQELTTILTQQNAQSLPQGRAFFVTGTDTDVGKTYVSCLLLQQLNNYLEKTAAMKPIAAGCYHTEQGWLNSDVEALRKAASLQIARQDINPYCFLPAISPHLAAADSGVSIDFSLLQSGLRHLRAQADCVLVEGAGGWMAPISAQHTMADLALALHIPVLLVVGMRLGCLNHALLSAEAIRHSGLPFLGWVANTIDPHMARFDDNLAYLSRQLGQPLAVVAHGAQACLFDCTQLLGKRA